MRIGGLVKQSLIDWEGVLSAVIFTKGCNLRCSYCHNPSLVLPSLMNKCADIPENRVLDYLYNRRSWLEGVVVTGGEPTLQHGLKNFLIDVKTMGYKIKLDTNGTNPRILNELINEKLVDAVAMDIKSIPEYQFYSAITPGITQNQMIDILESMRILQRGCVEYQFRTTILPEIHTENMCHDLREKFKTDPYVMHDFSNNGADGILSDYL